MRVTTVFNKLLALQGAFVRGVAFGPAGILVEVATRSRRHSCPRCAFTTGARYDRTTRDWRHLSLGRWRVVVRATLCRLVCPEHGVVTEAVPWAEHDSRFTRDFEDLVRQEHWEVERKIFVAGPSTSTARASTPSSLATFAVRRRAFDPSASAIQMSSWYEKAMRPSLAT